MIRVLVHLMLIIPGIAGLAGGADQQERQKKQVYAAAPGGSLEMHLASGNISIIGWDRSEVMVQAPELSGEDLDELRISQSGTTIHIEYSGGGSRDGDVTIRVSVPARFNVAAETGGGTIEIRGPLKGEIAGSTAGGEIRLASVGGSIRMLTSGGDIDAGDVDGTLELSSMGGEIHAGTLAGKTKISTGGGDVEVERAKAGLAISTAGGNIRVEEVDGNLSARTAGGDIEIRKATGHSDLNTAGGSVTVGSAPGGVAVRTAGGDLTLRNIGEVVEAETASGDVEVSFVSGALKESSIRTGAGNISVLIPPGLKATIKVKVYGGGDDWENDGAIQSDFKVKSREWNDRREELRATIPLNGGGEEITVVTHDGRVKILSSRNRSK